MARPVRKKNKPSAKDDKTLVLALTDAPRLMDRKAAQTRVAGWLTEIGRSAAGKTLKRLIADAPKLEGLLLGLADGSSFLWDLAVAEPERLLVVVNFTPDADLAELLAKAERAVAASKDEAEAMRLLRRMKAEAALLIALADIGGAWPVMRGTPALTDGAGPAGGPAAGARRGGGPGRPLLVRRPGAGGPAPPRRSGAPGRGLRLLRARDG